MSFLFGRTDDKGIICDQRGVFRVNCMDCLDRTNVVQAALARHIMEQQVKGNTIVIIVMFTCARESNDA